MLELLGASSASSDAPWFFVSPYYKNGSIVPYLKGLPTLEAADPLRMIHEIANGMAYLHGKEVLHGDLKVSTRTCPSYRNLIDSLGRKRSGR